MGMTWTLKQNSLPAIIASLNEKCGQTVQQVADSITADVKANAPVDTGALRDGYYNTMTDATTAEVRSGDDIIYAAFVEFGTRKMAAQPHFIPAFDRAAGQNLLVNVAKEAGVFEP